MRTIAIINQKGGCGKTTVSINLAAVLAAQGRKTLLVDMDPQSHCALGLAVPESQIDRSVADALKHGLDGSIAFADIIWQVSRNLDLAPSTMALAAIEAELVGMPDRDRRLTQVLSTVAHKYEFCIIDCPPSIGLLTFNALRASAEVFIPVETGYFSMQGAVRQEATIEMLARRANHTCRFKVLATMYDVRTKLAREILSELRRHFGDKLLPVVVNFNAKLKEAASFGQPITEYDPASRGMEDFEKLAGWLLSNPPVVEKPAGESTPVATAAVSRAAELVERARALSQRTATAGSRIEDDEDFQAVKADDPSVLQLSSPVKPRPEIAARFARVFGARATTQGVLFVQPMSGLPPVDGAKAVAVAGDFNGWNPAATPLKLDADLGVWQATLVIPPGRYRYRLVVDGKWTHDPYNTYVEANPFGELNNIVEVGAA